MSELIWENVSAPIFYGFLWVFEFYQAIFVSNPLLALFVILFLVGLGIGLVKRILN